MTESGQELTSAFAIREAEQPLIEAAIGLAGWMANRPEIDAAHADVIRRMREFLQNLPAPAPSDFNVSISFEFEPDVPMWDFGHDGCWSVCICRDVFEIFSVTERSDDLPEFSWELRPGRPNRNDLTNANAWIAQVSDPEKLILPGKRLMIRAEISSARETEQYTYRAFKTKVRPS